MRKPQPVFRKLIDIRSLDLAAKATHVGITHIVSEENHDIGAIICLCQTSAEQKTQNAVAGQSNREHGGTPGIAGRQ
jgi:hypothetical protein